MARRDRRPRSDLESLVTGLVLGGGFAAVWAFGGHPAWAIFAALFAGFLPAARGVSGLIAKRSAARALEPQLKQGEAEKALENERSVLREARKLGGRLTPAVVALDCDMSIEEAERVLDGLASKGHASLRVRDDGRLEYEFSEFLVLPPPSV